jgi:hypothetical protein
MHQRSSRLRRRDLKLGVLSLRICHRQSGYTLPTVRPRMDLHNLALPSLAYLLATTVTQGILSMPHVRSTDM